MTKIEPLRRNLTTLNDSPSRLAKPCQHPDPFWETGSSPEGMEGAEVDSAKLHSLWEA